MASASRNFAAVDVRIEQGTRDRLLIVCRVGVGVRTGRPTFGLTVECSCIALRGRRHPGAHVAETDTGRELNIGPRSERNIRLGMNAPVVAGTNERFQGQGHVTAGGRSIDMH